MKTLIAYPDRITIYAIVLLAIGLLLRYIIGKRRFNRRGIGGVQYFKSYGRSLITTTFERVLNIIATLMIIGAIILYLIR
ncbi:hypothetical protein BDD43_4324 [Mucilaginibacter gracilis]|uniref:Molybdenum ABC transporter permease n=1 Tax=Mucilaginibacter gracilis TaxID=423350 RepID=A0A495J569_9SPHI|nr:hypothetical protein [Mucilaginibacter gracilis]RKR84097.1 hypothetical protein BDD43_4324 [Mucilaginibacter gracilis]